MLVDKLVQVAEQEIADVVEARQRLQDSMEDTQRRIKALDDREKEARKVYKNLRKQQTGGRPARNEQSNGKTDEEMKFDPHLLPPGNHLAVQATQVTQSTDYQGALEILKAEDTEFSASEFAELANAPSRKQAADYLRTLSNRGRIVRSQTGTRGETDSARYQVI